MSVSETDLLSLALLVASIFIVNMPFGYWREGVRKFSPAWFVAVHAAVPIVVGMRLMLGIKWTLSILPFLVAAYFAGQAVGARLRRKRTTGRMG